MERPKMRLNPKLHTFSDSKEPDDAAGDYYVSCVDGGRFALLAGPFRNDHRAALAMVETVRKLAPKLDYRTAFYGFGTCRVERDNTRPWQVGVLNDRLGLGDGLIP